MDHIGVWFLVFLGFCNAQYNICPPGSARRVQNVFGQPRNVQRGVWHLLSCPELRRNEDIKGVIWYKGESLDDPSKKRLVSLYSGEVLPGRERFGITSDFSLVIQGVDDSDEGRYLCEVVTTSTGGRNGEIDIRVIGHFFPASTSEASSTASFQRGRRQTLPCECASQTPDVVYWSTGEGVTTYTQIIGARFSDGATLQIQYGADYSIGSDASLTVNSLHDVQDTQRFWCHVFQSDGTVRNCDTNAQILDAVESASDALKVSARSFYLRKDTQQILPCLSWTPGNTACEVEWSKLDNPDRQVLSYNLSTAVVDSSPEFDLASDFGLVIQAVGDGHAGMYRCAVGDKNKIDVEVRVIGDSFPLDYGIATEGDSVTFKPKTRLSLRCPALSDISLTTRATLYWSFGAPDAESTTVIGLLNLPDGPKKMSDLGTDCFGISMEGALLLNNCSQDVNVRYWCHVYPANNDLIRSYVDVLIENSNGIPGTSNIVAVAVCVPLFVIIIGIVVFLIRKRRRRSSHYSEDNVRGYYNPLDKQEPVTELELMTLASKIKSIVSSSFGRIPITSWVDGDDARFAPIDTVYRPLEMFANALYKGTTVRYQLDSESGIFDDGIPELASKHAIIQGRRGCGKTTFLYRLIYDWAMGREHALWGSDQIVVLVPAWLLIKAKTIGEAVVECMLPKDANISAESINAHYAQDKSHLTVLVDDCNDKDDINAVIKVMTDIPGCQLALTTRNAELAKAASRKYNMRLVTITGFSLSNAIKYINEVLNTAEDRKKATFEHKAVKSKSEAKAGSTTDTNTKQHLPKAKESPTVSAPPETKESTATDTFPKTTESPKTHTKNEKRNLLRYLEEDIVPPDILCLPAVLVALCQMSIWTKGDAFKPDVTMTNLFFRLVKCMFDRMKGLEVGVTEGNQLSLLTEDQLNVLAELGRVAYSRLVDGCGKCADFSKDDFLKSSDKGQHILEVAINVGVLHPLQVEYKLESAEQSMGAVSSEVSEFRMRKQKQQNGTEPDPMRQDTELTPLTSTNDERVCFVLEILEQLCVGVFLPQTTGKVNRLSEDITKIGLREILQRFSSVFQFAIQDNHFNREALVDFCARIIYWGNRQVKPRHVVLQKFVEMCLQLNFEGQCEGALNKKLKSIFPDGRIRLIGISSYKLRLLSYLLEHAQPDNKSKLNVKSVQLLQISKWDWTELQECIEIFMSGNWGTARKITVKTKTEDVQPSDEISTESKDEQSAHQEVIGKSSKHESQPAGENNVDDLSRSTHPEPKVGASPSVDDGHEDESTDLSPDDELKKLRERILSSNQDMPRFPPDESDISVLHTLQSFGLQELLESQAGECYSSGAARDLAKNLPRLEMLESLVLVGTILSSDAICDFAIRAHQLPNLKKLDLRLNKQFDDRAFVAVTNCPLRQCNKMTDLRLSLYKVTNKGFGHVQKEMKKDDKHSWGILKTLYLLHGSPAETFVGFLSNSLEYFQSVESFHLSARYKEQRIQNNTLEEFEQNMNNPKIMPNLKALVIGSMEALNVRLASLKLPKKKEGR